MLEQDGDLARLFTRYMDQVEVVSVRDAPGALAELSRSPALALISNGPPSGEDPLARVGQLPYGTPIMRCWVPGRDEAARRLGVEQYLVKPVTRDALLSAVEQLDSDVETILLVDDEPEVLQLFTRMFRSAGRTYRVLRAKVSLQALELLRRRRPDAMLLDLVMPGMDGLQVLWENSQDPAIQAIPTVVISSRDPAGDVIVGETLSVTHSGGFSVPALLECVRALGQILAPFSQPES